MRNVSFQMHRFKEASRHIWNAFLMPGEGVLDIGVEEAFEIVERELLRSMVLDGDASADAYRSSSIAGLLVRPKAGYADIPVMVGTRDAAGSMAWSLAEMTPAESLQSLEFLEFFDWNHYGYIDYHLVKATDRCSGRNLMIDNLYCEYWVEHQAEDDGT